MDLTIESGATWVFRRSPLPSHPLRLWHLDFACGCDRTHWCDGMACHVQHLPTDMWPLRWAASADSSITGKCPSHWDSNWISMRWTWTTVPWPSKFWALQPLQRQCRAQTHGHPWKDWHPDLALASDGFRNQTWSHTLPSRPARNMVRMYQRPSRKSNSNQRPNRSHRLIHLRCVSCLIPSLMLMEMRFLKSLSSGAGCYWISLLHIPRGQTFHWCRWDHQHHDLWFADQRRDPYGLLGGGCHHPPLLSSSLHSFRWATVAPWFFADSQRWLHSTKGAAISQVGGHGHGDLESSDVPGWDLTAMATDHCRSSQSSYAIGATTASLSRPMRQGWLFLPCSSWWNASRCHHGALGPQLPQPAGQEHQRWNCALLTSDDPSTSHGFGLFAAFRYSWCLHWATILKYQEPPWGLLTSVSFG